MDYERNKTDIQPLFFSGDCVERGADFKLLGITIEENLTWSANTTALVKKAQQRLLRKQELSEKLLVTFYRCSVGSILTLKCAICQAVECC